MAQQNEFPRSTVGGVSLPRLAHRDQLVPGVVTYQPG